MNMRKWVSAALIFALISVALWFALDNWHHDVAKQSAPSAIVTRMQAEPPHPEQPARLDNDESLQASDASTKSQSLSAVATAASRPPSHSSAPLSAGFDEAATMWPTNENALRFLIDLIAPNADERA